MSTRTNVVLSMSAWIALLAPPAFAQDYPSRQITMIMPFAAGGLPDQLGRMMAVEASKLLNQPIIVENRNGAAGNIGAQALARAPADGYTICFCTTGPLVIAQHVEPGLSFTAKDFAAITYVYKGAQAIIVRPESPFKTLPELLAAGKALPGTLSVGMSGALGLHHLSIALLESMAGVRFIPVPYAGEAVGLPMLMGGHLDLMIASISTTAPLAKGGKLRALAVTFAKRSPIMPDVPTVAELGYPGYEGSGLAALVAPSGTPQPVVDKLARAFIVAAQRPDIKDRIEADGLQLMAFEPAKTRATLDQDSARFSRAVKDANLLSKK